ncbi:hypothetical protein [Lacrimispora sp. 210928-DFI.3.58]|uniref:hypothetical protein n=1 Tax=Lacrimispora sp. 210928-DFI.3.58 TaxID=2883214 RepID=UPI001D099897|nr:hypothetical protein [Lacrimispora sp. 210928-DFI.3.58]
MPATGNADSRKASPQLTRVLFMTAITAVEAIWEIKLGTPREATVFTRENCGSKKCKHDHIGSGISQISHTLPDKDLIQGDSVLLLSGPF